ncbi:MAG TPA: error-prone DNA polymerase [Casimicrobiaceae bacterium]|nr:error-prone DNA polymerase [Casimicrobiaceae bacterium]
MSADLLPAYAELHCLSNFSFLRGASHPEELVERAHAQGYAALALTDECSVAGAVRAHLAARELGVRLVMGSEFTLVDGTKLVLLAPSRCTYGDLCQLITRGRRNAKKGQYTLTREDVATLASRCLALWVPALDLRTSDLPLSDAHWFAGVFPGRAWIAVELFTAAGDAARLARLQALAVASSLPLVASGDAHMHVRARRALQDTLTAIRLRTPVAQCGYALHPNGERHLRSRGRLATIYPAELLAESVAIAQRCEFSLDELRYEYPQEIVPAGETPTSWLRKLTELGLMRRYGPSPQPSPRLRGEGAGNTAGSHQAGNAVSSASADRLNATSQADARADASIPSNACAGASIPSPRLRGEGQGEGLNEPLLRGEHAFRCTTAPQEVRVLIEHELALIAELRYEPYFLTVHDIVDFARSREILCQGRGSAANSAVCYALGITEVDPSRMSMLFERFISKERNEPPDIDVDFEHQRREDVMQYVYGKYGRDRAALAATLITYRPKSAVRDVGKALGLDLAQVDRLAGIFAWWDGRAIPAQRVREAGFDPDNAVIHRLIALAGKLIGFPRHLSQHVGGFVIARGLLERMVPVENAAMQDRTVIQWDKDDLDALGLLKVDCLALGMLSAIRRALEMIGRGVGGESAAKLDTSAVPAKFVAATIDQSRERAGKGERDSKWVCAPLDGNSSSTPLRMQDIPAEDAEVYAMIQRADTIGVFQIESRAQMSMLPRLRPACFYDLVIEVAIVRPGPIQGGMVHPYLRRRQGLEPVTYPSEAVKAVLERTLGVPIFQEQVMQLAIVAAGFTPGEADRLRRSMAAWRRKGGLEKFEQRLIDGMGARGYSEEFARQIYQQILGFGEYGFPESHSASFALLVYVSCWLKRYHPAAFTAALLNSQPMGFYAPAQLVGDARRHGVPVLPVDVTVSDWDCTLERQSRDEGSGIGHEGAADRETTLNAMRGFDQLDIESRWPTVADPQPRASCAAPESWGAAGPALRLGLRMINGLTEAGAQRIMNARSARAFASVADLAHRAQLDRRDLQALADGDALRALSGHRHDAVWDITGVERLPQMLAGSEFAEERPTLPSPTEGQDIIADYRRLRLTLRRHPLALLRKQLQHRRISTAADVANMPHGRLARTAGIVIGRQRPDTASGVVFVTLEDETGPINIIVWRDVGDRQRRELLGARLMAVYGKVEREGSVVHIVAGRLVDMTPLLGELPTRSRDFH